MISHTKILSLLATIVISFNSFSQNQQIADSLYKTIDNSLEDTDKIMKIISFASNTYLNNSELALIFTKEALNQSIKANFQRGIADSYNLYGIIDMNLGNLERSKDNFFKALEIYQITKDNYGIVNIYNNLGLSYSDLGKYIDALDCYIKALKVLENYTNDDLLSLIFTNLGKLYIEVKNRDKAEEYLKKAEDLCIKANDTPDLIYIYTMLGSISLGKEQKDKALSYYNLAMKMSEETNNRVMVGSIHRSIGEVYFNEKNYEKAKENYEISLRIAEELNNSTSILRSLNALGYFYYSIKEYKIALEHLSRCYKLSEEAGFQEGIGNSSLHLSYVYYETGDYKLAYDYRIYHDSIYETMYSNETFLLITELFAKVEQEREEYELQILTQRKKIKTLLSYLIASVLLILFAALYLIQRKIAKRAIKKEEYLNKELTSKAIFLVRKNEIFAKIENILKEKKDKFIKENQGTIQEIINEIKQAQNEEVWKEFELYFNKVHKNFQKKLNEEFPNLSINDRKLCSLLRMNMTTKDISSITQQTAHTIDIARSRLRKKLGLSKKNTSLFAFLSKY